MDPALYFIENLTLRTWVFSLWPRLLWNRIRKRDRVICCYVIDGSQYSIQIASWSARLVGTAVEKLEFRLMDVRDESGTLIGLRIPYEDMREVQQNAMTEPAFQELIQRGSFKDRLPIFLAKNIASVTWSEGSTMWRALLLVQVSAWKAKQLENQAARPCLVLDRRPWLSAITRYANQNGVAIIPVRPALRLRPILRRRIPPQVINSLRLLRYRSRQRGMLGGLQSLLWSKTGATGTEQPTALARQSDDANHDPNLRIAVEYFGHLNLNHHEFHSDLFFWQKSSIPGRDMLVTFAFPADPLDEQKWDELKQHGIGALVLHPGATTIPTAPIFTHRPERNRTYPEGVSTALTGLEGAWLKEQIHNYQTVRAYWTDLFDSNGVKVYVSWFKYDGTHCAIADALQSLGGVTAIYQRAYESHPSPKTTIGADVVFGFNPAMAEIERSSKSSIRYHVATGYIGDHRFGLLADNAQTVRCGLQQLGAKHILAYSDEWSGDDPRWHTGHQLMRENYSFLLEKVLKEPWLGLVIKPKAPVSLRRRMGPVAELLERAEATGRCKVFEGGAIQGSYPPAAAALAADIALHGHLCAGTAPLETALAGVPTLMLDREGWPVSPLYRLGLGKVVFKDLDTLWLALMEHWASSEGIPGFGDWSPMLDELDPFRDGRAAERMGTYIQWLLEGFKAGLDRETIMADAAQRYCEAWGKDKVTEFSSEYSSPYAVTGQTTG